MKKLFAILFVLALCTAAAIGVSADLYSPDYYAITTVPSGAITLDGVVDEAYGEPIFWFVADGTVEPGDVTNSSNWYYTTINDEANTFVLRESENYVYGYAVWNEDALYLCFDTNIEGWQFENVAADGSDMWKAYCFQVGFFDYNNDSNVDWGVGINKNGTVLQYNFGQNNGSGTPKMVSGVTQYDAQAVRDGNHVIYEYQLNWNEFLSFTPTSGDCIGMDVCLDLCEVSNGGAQRCITFVNACYHNRNSADARRMYFVGENDKIEDILNASKDKEEMKGDEHTVPFYGANKAAGGLTLDTENQVAGSGCLAVKPGRGFVAGLPFDPVDASRMDTLEFDMYVSDVSIFDRFAQGGMDTGLEITSSGKEDAEEIAWHLAEIRDLNEGEPVKEGWNHIILPLSSGATTGEINLAAVNFMRIFMVNETEDVNVDVKYDHFVFTDKQAEKLAALQEKADKVIKKINDLPEITADNVGKKASSVNSAKSAYDKLDDEVKALVPADVLKKLNDALAAIEELNKPAETEPTETAAPGESEQQTEKVDEPIGTGTNPVGIIIAVAAAVVVIAAVVIVLLLKKKK